jgi:hypothetical protein
VVVLAQKSNAESVPPEAFTVLESEAWPADSAVLAGVLHAAWGVGEADFAEEEELFSAFWANAVDVFDAFAVFLLALEELVEEVAVGAGKALETVVFDSL